MNATIEKMQLALLDVSKHSPLYSPTVSEPLERRCNILDSPINVPQLLEALYQWLVFIGGPMSTELI